VTDTENKPRKTLPPEDSTGDAKLDERLAEPILQFKKRPDLALLCAAAFLIVMAGIFAYSNALDIPFHVEDQEWFADHAAPGPLTAATLAWNEALTPGNARAFHAVNLFIHLLNAILIFLICRRLLGNADQAPVAMLAGLFFVVHPLNTEAVNLAVGRFELLSACFVLASIFTYLRATDREPVRKACYVCSILCFAAACLSAPQGAILPILLLAVEGVRPDKPSTRNRWPLHAGYWELLTAFAVVLHMTQSAKTASNPLPVRDNLFSFLAAFPSYLSMTFYPAGLSVDHGFPVFSSLTAEPVCIGLVVLLLVSTAGLFWIFLRHLAGLAIFWYAAALAGTSLSAHSPMAFQERRAYLALAGGAMFVPWLFNQLKYPAARNAAGIVLAALIFTAGGVTFQRNLVWQSELDLWADAVRVAPEAARPNAMAGKGELLLGDTVEDRSRAPLHYRAALAHLNKALTVGGDNVETRVDLGVTLIRLGREYGGLALLRAAARQMSENQSIPLHIAATLTGQAYKIREPDLSQVPELFREAASWYAIAESLGPMPKEALLAYGTALANCGEFEKSAAVLERLKREAPSEETNRQILQVQAMEKRVRDLNARAEALLSADRTSRDGLLLRAQALLIAHRSSETFDLLETLLTIHPDSFEAWLLLGHTMARFGFTKAFIKTHPIPPPAPLDASAPWERLADACEKSGMPEAAEQYRAAAKR
jgi:tetratricopeptide (TPR) repeat protein